MRPKSGNQHICIQHNIHIIYGIKFAQMSRIDIEYDIE